MRIYEQKSFDSKDFSILDNKEFEALIIENTHLPVWVSHPLDLLAVIGPLSDSVRLVFEKSAFFHDLVVELWILLRDSWLEDSCVVLEITGLGA